MRFSRAAADLLLLFVAFIWGGTFVIVRDTVQSVPPFMLIGLRFLFASAAMMLLFPRSLRRWRADLKAGLLLAALLAGGFIMQTMGLVYTSASNSGFITGLNVVMVAVFASIQQRVKPLPRTMIAVILATLGLLFLSWRQGGLHFDPGDLLTLGCAVFFALHIVATGILAPGRDPAVLAGIQFAAVAVAGLALGAVFGGFRLPHASGWLVLAYLGLAATAFAFFVQTSAQRKTPAIDTAIILSAEPLFAAAIAVLLGGERLTAQMAVGGGSILSAMLISVVFPVSKTVRAEEPRPGQAQGG